MTHAHRLVCSLFAPLALAALMGCGSVTKTDDAGSNDGAAGGGAGNGGGGSMANGGSNGGAGSTGAGGHDASVEVRGTSCTDLQSQYAAALPAARSCTVGASDQCGQLVSSELSPCFSNCMTYVQDATMLNALKDAWIAAGCNNQGPIACPAIACLAPTKGSHLATWRVTSHDSA